MGPQLKLVPTGRRPPRRSLDNHVLFKGTAAVTDSYVVEAKIFPTKIGWTCTHNVGATNPADEEAAFVAAVVQDWVNHDFIAPSFVGTEGNGLMLFDRSAARVGETIINIVGENLADWALEEQRRHALERHERAVWVHANDHRISAQHAPQGHKI